MSNDHPMPQPRVIAQAHVAHATGAVKLDAYPRLIHAPKAWGPGVRTEDRGVPVEEVVAVVEEVAARVGPALQATVAVLFDGGLLTRGDQTLMAIAITRAIVAIEVAARLETTSLHVSDAIRYVDDGGPVGEFGVALQSHATAE